MVHHNLDLNLYLLVKVFKPKNSATIGRYDSVTKSMPSYDYVNQGTGSVNRPPIVSNPRDGK